jgi:hypothetical protein
MQFKVQREERRKQKNKHGNGCGAQGCAPRVKILNEEGKLDFSEIKM